MLQEIFQGYEEYRKKCQEIMTARLIYVTKPTQRQMDEMKQFLCSHFGKRQVLLELIEDRLCWEGLFCRRTTMSMIGVCVRVIRDLEKN